MKLKNLKISTQLRLSQGVILALVLGFGLFVWRQSDAVWSGTQTMFHHPMQVRTAIGNLRADILSMRLEFRDMFLAETDEQRRLAHQNSEVYQTNARRQFVILRLRYLGPIADIDAAEDAFARWISMREGNFSLAYSGKVAEAMARVAPGGDIGSNRNELLAAVDRIDQFANTKAQTLFRDVSLQHRAMKDHLVVAVAVILLLTLGVGWVQIKEIRSPLAALTATTKLFRQGHLDVRSEYVSANEFGSLSAAFNTMAEEIETQTQVSEDATELADLMLHEEDIHVFCRELLNGLMTHTGSQVGAIYFQNEARTSFVHFESVGLGGSGRAAFSASELEGELGAVLLTRKIQHVTDIPADTRFVFSAVSGDFTPREILTIPVLDGTTVAAVLSLASVRAYEPHALLLVDKIWSMLTARINGVLAFRKIHYFADQLEIQNQELEVQKRELAAQADELTEQNTELEMQKRQLHEANRLKSAFLSNMSHELRTPLNSVIALSGVLHRRLVDTIPSEEYGYLEVIERNGRNLLELINNILDLSRIEAGRDDLSASRFSVHEWVAEIVDMLEAQALDKNIALRNLVDKDLPLLHSDSVKCRHILQNLVGNAMKFTESGAVTISARQVAEDIEVTVRDTGIGIAADQLPHIFDEFRQADDGTARKYGGTGLGLAIARKYAQLLGGSITVTSSPGQGSCFTLRLPLVADWLTSQARPCAEAPRSLPLADVPGPAAAPAFASGNPHHTVLLVEDNGPAIIQLTDILHAQGYEVLVARDGREALNFIDQAVPDAMILDLMMPEVDGFEVLRSIRSQPRTAALPVLILTAKHVTTEELSFLKGNHIYQLIQKGDINKNGLLAAVARMLAPPPAAEPAAPPTTPPRPHLRRPTRSGQPLVLVVEDDADNLRTATALLGGHYQIITAEDGQAALRQARRHQPDLILSDLAMPVMDGFAVLAAIRDDETLCDIPVIAVTASAMKGQREEILAHGFDSYISKPIDHDVLFETLAGFLAPHNGQAS